MRIHIYTSSKICALQFFNARHDLSRNRANPQLSSAFWGGKCTAQPPRSQPHQHTKPWRAVVPSLHLFIFFGPKRGGCCQENDSDEVVLSHRKVYDPNHLPRQKSVLDDPQPVSTSTHLTHQWRSGLNSINMQCQTTGKSMENPMEKPCNHVHLILNTHEPWCCKGIMHIIWNHIIGVLGA